MIPDEVVVAAAKVYHDQKAELGYPKWEDLPELGREWRLGYMRTALEAAAPHIAAEAWDEGHEAGAADETDFYWDPSAADTPNPYRGQA